MDKKLLIEISANTKDAKAEIEKLKQEIKNFSENVKKSNSSLEQQEQRLQKLSNTIKKVVTAYAAFELGKSIVVAAAKFEQSMVNVKTIVGATNEQFEALRAKAKELGETTQFSASEAAEGMKYLAMAGYKTEEIIAAMPSVLDLATIGQTNLAEASDIASNILSGFGLKATETTRVVDVMAKTITNSNTDIKELGYAFSYAAPQAKALGVSVEEASAAIGVLSNAGIKGTMAGTGLAQILTRLSAPTGAAKDAIEQLGIKIFDAKGKFVGLQKALLQFNSALSKMSQEDRMRVIKEIFGEEAAKSALTLIDNVKTGYQSLYKEIEKASGASAKMAKEMQDTFEGRIKELNSALEALAIAIGEDLLPALSEFVKGLTEAVRGSKEFYEENKALIKTITELIAVFYGLNKIKALLIAVLGAGAAKEIRGFKTALMALIPIVGNLKNALLALSAVNPVLAALGVAIAGVTYALNSWEEEVERQNKTTDKLNETTKETAKFYDVLAQKYDIQTKSLKLLKDEKEKYLKKVDELIKKKKELLKTFNHSKDKAQISVTKESIRVLGLWKKKIEDAAVVQERLAQESEKRAKKIDYLTQEEIKAIKKKKEVQEREIESYRKLYIRRVDMHQSALERIKAKEQKILNDILEENRRFQQKLASIERNRLNALEDINNKIHNLNLAGASEYEKYLDKQKQAEERLAKAKEAIRRGDLEQAKRYINQYKSLIDSIANTEIKKDKKVIVSKKQAAQVAIGLLNRLKGVTNSYYELEKQKATQAHNMRLQQLKTQLQAVRAQIKLELERLKLEQQIVQMLTGKKVSIDTSSALQAIKQLDSQIKALDQQIKHPKKIDANTEEAQNKIKNLEEETKNKKAAIGIEADTNDAEYSIATIEDKITGKIRVFAVGAKTTEAIAEIDKVDKRVKQLHPKIKINSDISKVLSNLNKIPKVIVTKHIIQEVHRRANGGLIPRYSTGGEIDFKRVVGRVPGYDPSDKDDVPALLTRGEFVIKREAVKYYGDDFLYRLNSMALPKFATGGLVEQGRPEKLISELTKDNTSSYNENSDIADFIEQLKDIAEQLKNSNSPILTEIRKEIKRLEELKNKDEANRKEMYEIKERNEGKVLSKEEYQKFKEKKENITKKIEATSMAIKNEEKKVKEIIRRVKTYLKEVEAIKGAIEGKISYFGVTLPYEIASSVDLERLKKYWLKIENADIPNEQDLNKALSNVVNRTVSAAQRFYYSPRSTYLPSVRISQIMSRYRVTGYDVARELTKSISEAYSIGKILSKYINFRPDYRSFGVGSYQMPQEAINEVKRYFLKKVLKFKNGGKVPGNDPSDSDSILARLTAGEFVIRREAVDYYGANLLNALNSIKLPKFAAGGYVGRLDSAGYKDKVDINFNMPSGQNYTLNADIDVAKALAQEFRRLM